MLLVKVLQTCLMFTHSDCARLVMHCQEKGGLPANKGIELLSGLLWLQMRAGKTHEVLELLLSRSTLYVHTLYILVNHKNLL